MTPKDTALHTLGRTVVNFQGLEHNLKILASLAPFETYAHTVDNHIEKQREKAGRLTLGGAITSWICVLEGKVEKPTIMGDLYSATVRREMVFNIDPKVQEAHAAGLRTLLEERNTLIHGGLAEFPWESAPDCVELTDYLESLNGAIAEQMQFLEPIADSLRALDNGTLVIQQGDTAPHFVAYLVPKSDA